MKRSTKVAAPLLASAALAILAGCRKPEMQRCVDEQNHVVDDSLCANQPPQQQQRPMGAGSLIPLIPIYHYYYGGWGGYGLGSVVGGGSYAPSVGRSYATRSGATTRGGFGGSYSSGGGHGEGAGE
ncbi:MAG TPA: hypothetical protein VK578_21520 [Edaphobacter sp.]|jgi:hypothetical protein|nr:hypothetical protein [Edaphobacter sp.]